MSLPECHFRPRWVVRAVILAALVVTPAAMAPGSPLRESPSGLLAAHSQGTTVSFTFPLGGETLQGGSETPVDVTWTTAPPGGSMEFFYRDAPGALWRRQSVGGAGRRGNFGSFSWFVPNTPTSQAQVRVRVFAGELVVDAVSNPFTIQQKAGGVGTTLRDFRMPGTPPFGTESMPLVVPEVTCQECHQQPDPPVSPEPLPTYPPVAGITFEYGGTMMSQAARDPLFYAALAIAEQDAPSSGDLCIRCHSPGGWLNGHSQPTSGSRLLDSNDRSGVSCLVCHLMVDPKDNPGNPSMIDGPIRNDLDGMMPSHLPTDYSNGQYVVDPESGNRRGPLDPLDPPHINHAAIKASFQGTSEFCGTCHDVSNPVFERVGTSGNYQAGTLDMPPSPPTDPSLGFAHSLMPLERTFSEWQNSDFRTGVTVPVFGAVSKCQDCHRPVGSMDPDNRACRKGALRPGLRMHYFVGGNTWIPKVIKGLADQEGDLYYDDFHGTSPALSLVELDSIARKAQGMLYNAAELETRVTTNALGPEVKVTVTNNTGHKLPTGYPEGRRMWLHLLAKDVAGNTLRQWGAYDGATGDLDTASTVVYEAKLGRTDVNCPEGPPCESFHFVLNNAVVKDNRIPPRGFTNAKYEEFGGKPVDGSPNVNRYADGQYSDTKTFGVLPPGTTTLVTRLMYQTASKEYVEFLRDENSTTGHGSFMYNLWVNNDRSKPVVMDEDLRTLVPITVSATPADGGTVSPPHAVLVPGDDQTFTFTPKPGYDIAEVKIDGTALACVTNHYTFHAVTEPHRIDVTFQPQVGWPADGRAITQTGAAENARSVADGAGGAYVLWTEGSVVLVQHMMKSGELDPTWPVNGLRVSAAPGSQHEPMAAADGFGGIIVALTRRTVESNYITVQRIFHPGLGGPTNGLTIAAGSVGAPTLVSDGAGGAIVAWVDGRNDAGDIYAQHVLMTGVVDTNNDWPADGRSLCASPGLQGKPVIATDGAGGAIVAWQDVDVGGGHPWAGGNINIQHVLATGTLDPRPDWNSRASPLATAGFAPSIVSDGAGGAIIVWQDNRNGGLEPDIYAQRVLATGALAGGLWAPDGLPVRTFPGAQLSPAVVSDLSQGAIIAWNDLNVAGRHAIYAHHVLGTGALDTAPWPREIASSGTASKRLPVLASDAAGGAIVAWQSWTSAILAQHVLSSGGLNPDWSPIGRIVRAQDADQPTIVADAVGTAIVAWTGSCGGGRDVYAQRVRSRGPTFIEIYVTPPNGGTVSPSAGGWVAVWPGEDQSFTFTPNPGREVAEVKIDGTPLACVTNHYTFIAVTEPHRIDVTFQSQVGWPADGRAITQSGASYSYGFQPVADGAGGAYVPWTEGSGVLVHHVMRSGELDPGWPVNGRRVSTGAGDQFISVAAADGAGGIIVALTRRTLESNYITVQRIQESGQLAPGWGPDGLTIAEGSVGAPTLVSDGAGGAIVAWVDGRNDAGDIYAQHVLGTGVVDTNNDWPADGRALCPCAGFQVEPVMATDGAGGAIVAWRDFGSYGDGWDAGNINIQHVLATGTLDARPDWASRGSPLAALGFAPSIVSDGAGGVIIAWQDGRNGRLEPDIFAQRVLADGALAGGLWAPDGLPVCTVPGAQLCPAVVSDLSQGAIIAWNDSSAAGHAVLAHHVLSSGALDAAPWPQQITAAAASSQFPPVLASDAAGGAIFAWQSATSVILAQHVLSSGGLDPVWPPTGREVRAPTAQSPTIVADASGGAIVTWAGVCEVGNVDIYAQRLTSGGIVGAPPVTSWTQNGVQVAPSTGTDPAIVSDAQGGALVSWTDAGGGVAATAESRAARPAVSSEAPATIYLGRLNATGAVATGWPAGGVRLSGAVSQQSNHVSVPDHAGGTIVVWQDDRNGDLDLYAQRVSGAGVIASGWPEDGLRVCDDPGNQRNACVVEDGAGGALVFWEDRHGSGGSNLYAQRLAREGTIAPGWPARGLPVCTAPEDQLDPVAVSDGFGGAVVAWIDKRSGTKAIFATRVTPAGTRPSDWPIDGLPICPDVGVDPTQESTEQPDGAIRGRRGVAIASDGAGGAFIGWTDWRNAAPDIFTQHVTAAAGIDWKANGEVVCDASGSQKNPRMIADGIGGAIIVWEDGRAEATTGTDLYAQRVRRGKPFAPAWSANGAAVSTEPGEQTDPAILGDGGSGALAAWKSGDHIIRGARITASGSVIANPLPVCDVVGTKGEPSIASDGLGGAIVTWTDGRDAGAGIYAAHLLAGPATPGVVAAPLPGLPIANGRLTVRPNPTLGSVTLGFQLAASERVSLEIMDVTGRRLRTISDGREFSAGVHSLSWDGRDVRGARVSAGIYFVRLGVAEHVEVRRVAVLR